MIYFLFLISMSFAKENVSIPVSLMNKLVGESPRFYYGSAKIIISHPGLGPEPRVIDLPEGGGTVDLATIIPSEDQNFFSVKFNFEPAISDLKLLKAFYIQKKKPFHLADLQFGAQCNSGLELSSQFREKGDFASKGMQLSSANGRYAHTLGGDLFFSYPSDGETYVTYVRFIDSRLELPDCSKVD